MAINVHLSAITPAALLDNIKKAVRDGTVATWALDDDGDFTHTPQQWNNQAYMRPRISPGGLDFFIVGRKSVKMSKEIYAVYHGRFAEMLLRHFDNSIHDIRLSSWPESGDII